MEHNFTLNYKITTQKLPITAFEPALNAVNKDIEENKTVFITNFLKKWFAENSNAQTICKNIILPSKQEFATFFNVSLGTIQNVLRNLEDAGVVTSKQRIGTVLGAIKNKDSKKTVSKRDMAANSIKKYLFENKLSANSPIPSARELSRITGFALNTTMAALELLAAMNIISKQNSKERHLLTTDFSFSDCEQKNLTQVVIDELKTYIIQNLKRGDRIPSHDELAKRFNVSTKTIHDALTLLCEEGVLFSRRGRYGTIVSRMPNEAPLIDKPETSIFAPAKDTVEYYYEKTRNHIKNLIATDYEIGQKLPSIQEMSQMLDLSPNTVRRAFASLAEEGYLRFSRGRYGGTFVIDIPESTSAQSFKWLAVNPKYAKTMI